MEVSKVFSCSLILVTVISSIEFWGHDIRRISVKILPTQNTTSDAYAYTKRDQTHKRENSAYAEYEIRRISVKILPTQNTRSDA